MRSSRCARRADESIRTRAPPWWSCATACVAESQNHWPSLEFDLGAMADVLAPIIPGRLLLQDVHVAGFVLEEALRARDPRRGRPRARSGAAGSRSLPAPPCALRRADRGRRARRPGSGARGFGIGGKRVIVADENAQWGGRSLPQDVHEASCSTATEAQRHPAPPHHGVRHLRPQPRRHAAAHADAARRAAPATVAGARGRDRFRGRRARASARLCGQRPARHPARGQRAAVRAQVRRRAGSARWSSRPAAIPPTARRATC